jgi:predicted Rossmann fold flavoprotein
LSVPFAEASSPGTKLKEAGPLLITHSGFSGPAVIKLSAWGARLFAEKNYQFILRINFCGQHTIATATEVITRFARENPRKYAVSINPFEIPQRLWERLVVASGVGAETPWTSVAKGSLVAIATQVCAAEFSVTGKSMFKEEFVTCGGVALNEVEFKTMESKKRPGLHFAGEVLDIDGVTGGFNFQSAWTTGWLAGQAMGS